jgi:Tfp pilus assembly protein PilF
MVLANGRLDTAYECLTEALAIFHQVNGPMHPDTATTYTNLGMVLFHAGDAPQVRQPHPPP